MASTYLELLDKHAQEGWKNLRPQRRQLHPPPELPEGYSMKKIDERWDHLLKKNKRYIQQRRKYPFKPDRYGFYSPNPKEELLDKRSRSCSELYSSVCENFIGTLKIPLGIAGPLLVKGLHAQGNYFIPLATTEAALVASIARGISVINQSGGVVAAVTHEGINRDPMVCFRSIREAFEFVSWSTKSLEMFQKVTARTCPQAQLITIRYIIDGRDVHLKMQFLTGEEEGQDLATIAASAVLELIHRKTTVPILRSFIEGGMTGEGRAKHSSLLGVRGRRVVGELIIKRDVAETMLHCSVEQIMESTFHTFGSFFWNGTIGAALHSSNALTALNLALGQKVSSASECHVAVTKTDFTENRDIYMSVTMPNILVGTVGGGTILPSQRACLELMGLSGSRTGNANRLTEIIVGVVIAGEISLGSAVVSGDFAKAHKVLRGSNELIDLANDTLHEQFMKSQGLMMKLSEIPPRKTILEIYGLYKQATVGDINIPKPVSGIGFSSMKIKAKYEAWKKKKGMTKEEAMKIYIETALKLHNEDDERIMSQNKKLLEEMKQK